MKLRSVKSVIIAALLLTGCERIERSQKITVILGVTANMNSKCVGHAEGLCGTEDEMLPLEIAGVFATEPDCQGLKLRGLAKQESSTPSNQVPLLFDLYYEGSPHGESYAGTGKGEDEGWKFSFNGPHGHFSAWSRTEREAIRRMCLAAKGQGGEVDSSVGYSH